MKQSQIQRDNIHRPNNAKSEKIRPNQGKHDILFDNTTMFFRFDSTHWWAMAAGLACLSVNCSSHPGFVAELLVTWATDRGVSSLRFQIGFWKREMLSEALVYKYKERSWQDVIECLLLLGLEFCRCNRAESWCELCL